MAPKKKKKKRGEASAPKPDDGFGTLRDKIKPVRREIRATRREAVAEPVAPARPTPGPAPKPTRRLTRDELMAEAFGALENGFASNAKYLGEGYDASDVEVIRDDEPADVPNTPEGNFDGPSGDDMLFFEAMTAVKRIEDGKSALAEKTWSGMAWRTETQLESLTAEQLVALEMTPAHRDLLRRSRKAGIMPVINVRHLRRADAMGEV